MFSVKDMVRIMGPNTAEYVHMPDQIGTLEAGTGLTAFLKTAIRSRDIGTG